MARLITSGGEIRDHPTTNVGSPDGWSAGAALTTSETTNMRSGTAAIRCPGTAANTSYRAWAYTAPASGPGALARVWLRPAALPTATRKVVAFVTSADGALVSVRLTSTGQLQLWNDVSSAQIGSDSTLTVVAGEYVRVQLRLQIGAGAVDQAEMRVRLASDPTEEAVSGSSLTISDTHTSRLRAGWIDAPGSTTEMIVDGVAVNDTTGTAESSWPGDGVVLLSKPVWTSWTASTATDCSGTSPTTTGANMADAVNNTPPLGVADHTTGGHAGSPDQVRVTSTSTMKAFCQTFAELGGMGDAYFEFSLGAGLDQIGSGTTTGFNGDQLAQSFNVNGTLEKVAIRLESTLDPNGTTDDAIVDLVEDNAGLPTGALIQSWNLGPVTSWNPDWPASPQFWVECVLTTPLPAYRKLWITVRRSGANNGTVHLRWRGNSTEMLMSGWPGASYRSGAWTEDIRNRFLRVYTSQGYRAPKVVTGWMCHGEAVGTGTKTYGTFNVVTTAKVISGTSGNIGNDVGAAGTYPSNWAWSASNTEYRPPATDAGANTNFGSPRIGASITSAARFSLLCFVGAYVELDEVYTGGWAQYQKTSDSSQWFGKQAVASTTYELADGSVKTITPGNWALYPSPQIDGSGDFPATLVEVTDEDLQELYTRV
jgi:hypothetical protein